jgi:hypothetical protein
MNIYVYTGCQKVKIYFHQTLLLTKRIKCLTCYNFEQHSIDLTDEHMSVYHQTSLSLQLTFTIKQANLLITSNYCHMVTI